MVLIHQSGGVEASADMPQGNRKPSTEERKPNKRSSLHVGTHINKLFPHCSEEDSRRSQNDKGASVTCASRPLVPSDVGSVVGVDLAVFRGADVQAAVPLDGDLMTETDFMLSIPSFFLQ